MANQIVYTDPQTRSGYDPTKYLYGVSYEDNIDKVESWYEYGKQIPVVEGRVWYWIKNKFDPTELFKKPFIVTCDGAVEDCVLQFDGVYKRQAFPGCELVYKRTSKKDTAGTCKLTLQTITKKNVTKPTTPTTPDPVDPDPVDPTTPTTPTTPKGDFNYQPLPNRDWPLYRDTPYRDIYERKSTQAIGKVARLKNDYIMIEIWESFGGTIAWMSAGDADPNDYTKNVVNNPDRGRNFGLTFYGGPVPTKIPPGKQQNGAWTGFRWDPISVGDSFNNGSPVLAFGYTDNMLYVKRNCLDWSLDYVLTDLIVEEWIRLNGRAVESFVRITNNRSDLTFYDNSSHEFPQMMLNGANCTLALYNGPKPFTKAPHKEFKLSGMVNGQKKSFHMAPALQSENWSAIKAHNDALDWWGLVTPVSFANNADSTGFHDEGAAYTFMDPMTVQRCTQPRILDAPGVIYHRYSAVRGSIDQIRDYAYAMAKPDGYVGKPYFVWNKSNGRCDWVLEKATDPKEPFPKDYWDVTFGNAPDLKSDFSAQSAAVTSPYLAWNGSDFDKIYLYGAYTGKQSQLRFTWMVNAQFDAFFGEGPAEEKEQRFYNGELPRYLDEQTVFFDVKGDGQFRLHTIDLAGKDRWKNYCIQRATIGYHHSWRPERNENFKFVWMSADKNGNKPS